MNTRITSTVALCATIACTVPVSAEKICPEGKSYRSDLCKEVHRKPDGTVEVYPVGKSYDREQVMEGKQQADGSMRFCPKGRSYDRDACWTMAR